MPNCPGSHRVLSTHDMDTGYNIIPGKRICPDCGDQIHYEYVSQNVYRWIVHTASPFPLCKGVGQTVIITLDKDFVCCECGEFVDANTSDSSAVHHRDTRMPTLADNPWIANVYD